MGSSDRSVTIGSHCYIGSAVRFAPGSKVGNNCIITMGSVVTKKFCVDNALIRGVPAKVIRADYDWKSRSTLPQSERDG